MERWRCYIGLTSEEQQLFDILNGVVKRYNLNTTVRVAGGWVRDKLLGRDNHDIDIALDDMTGLPFATHVNNYLAEQNFEVHRIGVIERNPEQSKHLETATVKILDMPIDFVNLRAEEYTEESRIPTVRFGTPKEDAERRDFTINSLFYNVNKAAVEDFTGKGVEDLERGLIRTPLEPVVTLLDDPLRVLRAVRFSGRYGFELVSDLKAAILKAEVQEALRNKVSRERVMTELDGMLSGPRPIASVRLMNRLELLPVIFHLPPKMEVSLRAEGSLAKCASSEIPELFTKDFAHRVEALVESLNLVLSSYVDPEYVKAQQRSSALPSVEPTTIATTGAITLLEELCGTKRLKTDAAAVGEEKKEEGEFKEEATQVDQQAGDASGQPTPTRIFPKREAVDGGTGVAESDFTWSSRVDADSIRLLLLACLCEPLSVYDEIVTETKRNPAAGAALKLSFKAKTKDLQDVSTLLRSAWQFYDLAKEPEQLAAGRVIREAKELWPLAIELAAALHACVQFSDSGPQYSIPEASQVNEACKLLGSLLESIKKWGIADAWQWKPLLSGKDLMKLGAPKGKRLGELVNMLVEWHLMNPSATKEEATAFITAKF